MRWRIGGLICWLLGAMGATAMSEFKLVPVDLLSELTESLAAELDARYPASVRSYESQDRKYQAEMEPVLTARQIIAAAPAAQGAPENWREKVADLIKVAHCEGQKSATGRDPSPFRWVNSESYKAAQALLADPTPEAVQGEPVATLVEEKEFSKGATHPVGDCGHFVSGINRNNTIANPYQWDHQIVVYGRTPEQAEALRDRVLGALDAPAAPQPTEQQPEPDVSALVKALEASTHRLHEPADGEDDCRCSQCRFVRLRDAALAAYRSQGGE